MRFPQISIFCKFQHLINTAKSIQNIRSIKTKMPPKKAVKEEKLLLGRPGNNLKSKIFEFGRRLFADC
jgi:hypothetical protein